MSPDVVLSDKIGHRQEAPWEPFDVELVDRQGRRALEPVDAIYVVGGGCLVVKDAALPRVVPDLAESVEFLPLRCPQEPVTLLNVVQVSVAALDEEESDLKRFPSSGRTMYVGRPVFRADAAPSTGLFRVPQALSRMFCTDATAALLRERLTGLNLEPVWEG